MSPLTTNGPPTIIFDPRGSFADIRRKPVRRDLIRVNAAWCATVAAVYAMSYGGFLMLAWAWVLYGMWLLVWRERFPEGTRTIFFVVYVLFPVSIQQLVTTDNPGWIIIAPITVLLQLYCNWGLVRAKYAGGN